MEGTTLVTGFFDLNDVLNKKLAWYIAQGDKLLQMPCNLVLFTDRGSYESIYKIRKKYGLLDKTCFITQNLSDFPYYKYKDKITVNRASNLMYVGCRNTPDYFILVASKFAMLKKAYEMNPFESKYFIWTDFGIFGQKYSTVEGFNDMMSHPREKFSACYIHYRTKAFIENNRSFFCGIAGGVMSATIEYHKAVEKIFTERLDTIIKNGYGHAEEQILTEIHAHNPELFDVYYGDYQSCLSNYVTIKYDISSILKHYIINTRDDGKHQYSYNACRSISKSLEAGHLKYEFDVPGGNSDKEIVNAGICMLYYTEYFISSWYTHNMDECISIVKSLGKLLGLWNKLRDEYMNNYQFYTDNFDFISMILPSKENIAIFEDVSPDIISEYTKNYNVYIYQDDWFINENIFLTSNPVIRSKKHIRDVTYKLKI